MVVKMDKKVEDKLEKIHAEIEELMKILKK